MLAVSVFAAGTMVGNKVAPVITIVAEIVFGVETKTSKRDLARVRKKFGDKPFRNQCKMM